MPAYEHMPEKKMLTVKLIRNKFISLSDILICPYENNHTFLAISSSL